eukprot:11399-Heterococcus_DN1.PRE.2
MQVDNEQVLSMVLQKEYLGNNYLYSTVCRDCISGLKQTSITRSLESLEMFKMAIDSGILSLVNQHLVIKHLAEAGELELIKYASSKGHFFMNQDMFAYAASGGHMHVLKYLVENRCEWDRRACHWAARGGHLDVLYLGILGMKILVKEQLKVGTWIY